MPKFGAKFMILTLDYSVIGDLGYGMVKVDSRIDFGAMNRKA